MNGFVGSIEHQKGPGYSYRLGKKKSPKRLIVWGIWVHQNGTFSPIMNVLAFWKAEFVDATEWYWVNSPHKYLY